MQGYKISSYVPIFHGLAHQEFKKCCKNNLGHSSHPSRDNMTDDNSKTSFPYSIAKGLLIYTCFQVHNKLSTSVGVMIILRDGLNQYNGQFINLKTIENI